MGTLVGRTDESAALERAIAEARAGRSAVLLLRGDPGIGKTALLEHAADAAGGFVVLRIVGVESERDLPFAGLHRLLASMLDTVDSLPPPQRDALRVVFGLDVGATPDRLYVGLGALTVLAGAAARTPILCVIDDVQWLDEDSARALAFVARRLHADSVAMIFAARDVPGALDALDGLDTLQLDALRADAASELVRAVVLDIDEDVVNRVVLESEGNPLTLVELGSSLTPEQRVGDAVLPAPLPLGRDLEARYMRQVHELEDDVQLFLLAAAAEGSTDASLVTGAAAALGLPSDTAARAEASRFVRLEPSPTFRHPLIRAAVYHGASTSDRRRVHAALAAISDRAEDEHRRAWHLAAASEGLSEEIARALEASAHRARGRGGDVAAAAFLTRAAEMTPDPARRAARTLAAATADLNAGAPTRALSKVDTAFDDLDNDALRASALRLQGTSRIALGLTAEALPMLVASARALAPFNPEQARETLLDAVSAVSFTGRRACAPQLEEIAAEATRIGFPSEARRATSADLLLAAFAALYTRGVPESAPLLRRAIERVDRDDVSAPGALRRLGFGCLAAGSLGDYERVHGMATRLVTSAREQGALVDLSRGLYFLAFAEVVRGALDAAADAFSEGRDIRMARGDPAFLGGIVVYAWRGQLDEARATADAIRIESDERRQQGVGIYADHGLTVLELSRSNYPAALEHAERVDAEDSYFLSALALSDLVEAAVRSGESAVASEALARLEARANAGGAAFALGVTARSQALVRGEAAAAEPRHRAAIDLLAESGSAGHLARADLLYGEWLRRQRRRRDAREQLRLALDQFEAMGAATFASRARQELQATGERARQRTVDTATDLTPQEHQVARLAASGATNTDIAAQLFISANTVDYHLRKVYRKLDISSRRDLGDALATR